MAKEVQARLTKLILQAQQAHVYCAQADQAGALKHFLPPASPLVGEATSRLLTYTFVLGGAALVIALIALTLALLK